MNLQTNLNDELAERIGTFETAERVASMAAARI